MSRRFVFLIVVVIAALVAAGSAYLALRGGEAPYAAVYLTTGDIYFGRMDWFPVPHLEGVWYVQRGTDAKNQPQLGVAPFKSVFWGPVDEVYLNPKTIVWWTRLQSDSEFLKAVGTVAQ